MTMDIFDKGRLESYMDSLGAIDYAEWAVRREEYLDSLKKGLRDSLDRTDRGHRADAIGYADDICAASARSDFDGCDFRRFHQSVVRLADMVEDALLKAVRRKYVYNPWRALYSLVSYGEGKPLYDMLSFPQFGDGLSSDERASLRYASLRPLLVGIREKYGKSATDYGREG